MRAGHSDLGYLGAHSGQIGLGVDIDQYAGGAKRIMARYPSKGVEVGDPGVLIDVDTEADLATVRSQVTKIAVPGAH